MSRTTRRTFFEACRSASIRSAKPSMESFERRQLMAAGLGYIQGTAFLDSSKTGTLTASDAYLPKATIQLYNSTSSTTPLATTTTDANGAYSFTGLAAGNYVVKEIAPAGYVSTAAQVESQLDPATVVAPNSIAVTVVDPTKVYADFMGFEYDHTGNPNDPNDPLNQFDEINDTVNGISQSGSIGVMPTGLGTTLGATNLDASFIAFCADDLHTISPFGAQYQALPATGSSISNGTSTGLPDAGRIGYLFNQLASPTVTKVQAGGLQLAIWELIYGIQFNVTTAFQGGPTSPIELGAVEAQATADILASAGKSETVGYLDPSLGGTIAQVGQGLLFQESMNFGNAASGALSGFVYVDTNNNGVKDAGEAGLGGVSLTLSGTTAGGVAVTGTTKTAADGSYSFSNLAPGTYGVTETPVPGYAQGKTSENGTQLGVTTSIPTIAVPAGVTSPNNNFAEVGLGTISGHDYHDTTGNGLSSDDTAFGGLTINLYANGNATGTPIATTTTAADGSFLFTGLVPGTYSTSEVVPGGYVQTGPATTTYYTDTISPAAENATGNDFDNALYGCACDYAIVSETINGTTPIQGLRGNTHEGDLVAITFAVPAGKTATLSLVSYTAPNSYFVAGQAAQQVVFDQSGGKTYGPGTYTLSVQIPNSDYQIDFVCGQVINQFGPAGSNIFYGQQGRLEDADNGGYEPQFANGASLAGTVYNDLNDNGVFNARDVGLAGVKVNLTGTDAYGNSVSLTRITAADGTYSFKGLQPGTYAVSIIQPNGYITTKNAIGTVNGSTDGHLATPTTNTIDKVALASGNNGVSYNFGELKLSGGIGCKTTATDCFWNGCQGQALINAFNGGSSSTALSGWLASTFPNLYGSGAWGNNLTGKTNAQVASFFQSLEKNNSEYAEVQVLATALDVYATTASLGGTAGAAAGFSVSVGGLGAESINVQSLGSLFGVCNNTNLAVIQLLQSMNNQAVNGILFGGDCTDRYYAYVGFSYLNSLSCCC